MERSSRESGAGLMGSKSSADVSGIGAGGAKGTLTPLGRGSGETRSVELVAAECEESRDEPALDMEGSMVVGSILVAWWQGRGLNWKGCGPVLIPSGLGRLSI